MARLPASLVVLALCRVASAQPAPPPPAPAPAPAPGPAAQPQDPYAQPPGQDPVLAEQVATELVTRAQELIEQQMYVEAKQLAVEALVKSPKGQAADKARAIIRQSNQVLGIKDEPAPTTPSETRPEPPDLAPIQDPTLTAPPAPPAPPVAEGPTHSGKTAATVHGALYLGLVGATIGSFFDDQNPAGGAVPVGLAAGLAGALFVPSWARKWDEAQVRTVGSASVWGGVVGGLFADVVTGANGGQVSAQGVLVGASLGATVTGLVSTSLAKEHKLTSGDVALVDTLAGVGTAGGLTLGMLMQPAQKEAYSLNGVIGAAAGVITGLVAAPKTNTTPRRMLRVAGVAAVGGGLPFLLYAGIHDAHATWDDRLTGGLSTLGLVGGAALGFYLTRHLDEGMDVNEARPAANDAPIALVGRSSDGRWTLGGLGLVPTSPQLSPQHGVTVTVAGATF